MIDWLVSIFLGFSLANILEWYVHKNIFHGLGKNQDSFWSYHLYQHHVDSKQHNILDKGYQSLPIYWNTQGKEALILILFVLCILPLVFVVAKIVFAIYLYLIIYYYKHRKAHTQPGWAQKYLPWHYQHHRYTPNANWCVTWPWFDWIMGTRRKV